MSEGVCQACGVYGREHPVSILVDRDPVWRLRLCLECRENLVDELERILDRFGVLVLND